MVKMEEEKKQEKQQQIFLQLLKRLGCVMVRMFKTLLAIVNSWDHIFLDQVYQFYKTKHQIQKVKSNGCLLEKKKKPNLNGELERQVSFTKLV
jgi:uncharacterized metal-binding protein